MLHLTLLVGLWRTCRQQAEGELDSLQKQQSGDSNVKAPRTAAVAAAVVACRLSLAKIPKIGIVIFASEPSEHIPFSLLTSKWGGQPSQGHLGWETDLSGAEAFTATSNIRQTDLPSKPLRNKPPMVDREVPPNSPSRKPEQMTGSSDMSYTAGTFGMTPYQENATLPVNIERTQDAAHTSAMYFSYAIPQAYLAKNGVETMLDNGIQTMLNTVHSSTYYTANSYSSVDYGSMPNIQSLPVKQGSKRFGKISRETKKERRHNKIVWRKKLGEPTYLAEQQNLLRTSKESERASDGKEIKKEDQREEDKQGIQAEIKAGDNTSMVKLKTASVKDEMRVKTEA
ncbi:MAG: hypothetical protein Q9218_007348 [Villophora microphyllina]